MEVKATGTFRIVRTPYDSYYLMLMNESGVEYIVNVPDNTEICASLEYVIREVQLDREKTNEHRTSIDS